MKNQYRGWGLPEKGAWTVCRFKGGGLGKNKGVVFLRGRGGLIPSAHYDLFPGTNHNHSNSDETNQTNIVVRRVGILGTL